MNKRGQFYLIAAIIIIALISGILVYNNYGRRDRVNSVIYDLGKDLKLETGNVYDYGTYNSISTETLIDDWTTRYYEYSKTQGSVEDWIFLYGNEESLIAMTFSVISEGEISITPGTAPPVSVSITKEIKNTQRIDNVDGNIELEFNNIKYNFQLKEGENFFFVIKGGQSTAVS